MPDPAKGRFPTTRWTLIGRLQSGDEAEARHALDDLCSAYHYPLYCYIRRRGLSHHDAQDALHEFLAKLLRLDAFASADEARGRLRTFLTTALHRFLINWRRDRQHTTREIGCDAPLPGDDDHEERYRHERLHDGETPERLFERKWVHELLGRVLRTLEHRYALRGKSATLTALRPALTAGGTLRGEDLADLAAQLGISENAVRIKFSRLLREYRQALEDEVLQTVSSPEDIPGEIAYLMGVFE